MKSGASATSQKSVQDAKKKLQKFLRKIDTVPLDILAEKVDPLYSEIIAEIPYETGALEQSVRVSVSRDKKRPGLNASASARSDKGYNYAGIQHEEEDFHHPKPGAKAHYISDPFERTVKRIETKMRERLKIE